MANLKENKRYHFTYKTVNLVNGRYYLGMHSTNKLDDGYVGSGKRLWYEIRKYGKENFKLEILEHFNSREEVVQAEGKLITEEDLTNVDCLNIVLGGSGGNVGKGEEHLGGDCWAAANRYWNTEEGRKRKSEMLKIRNRRLLDEGVFKTPFVKGHQIWKGKKHTPETIEKMKQSHKGAGKGNNNSQYGTCWITNGVENKKIKKEDQIPEGWRLGRKLKKL